MIPSPSNQRAKKKSI